MNWASGKENIKMENRLLFEKDVIKAVDKHTNDDYVFITFTSGDFYTQ